MGLEGAIDVAREDDGRWIAEVRELPGVMAYGESEDTAVRRVTALALRVLANRIEHQETRGPLLPLSLLLRTGR